MVLYCFYFQNTYKHSISTKGEVVKGVPTSDCTSQSEHRKLKAFEKQTKTNKQTHTYIKILLSISLRFTLLNRWLLSACSSNKVQQLCRCHGNVVKQHSVVDRRGNAGLVKRQLLERSQPVLVQQMKTAVSFFFSYFPLSCSCV